MVRKYGIDISVISQFDIRRLPEFDGPPARDSNSNNVVSRYIPVYPGSQLWFEYTVEPPHPPNAAYLFKLLINGHKVSTWDCTEKYGYHGKMIYTLEQIEPQQSHQNTCIRRRGFRFRNNEGSTLHAGSVANDYFEIQVHRIEHRRQIHGEFPYADEDLDQSCGTQLQLVNGGILEERHPIRRYKYQLLDPVDVPYAVFRFYYRTHEHLQRYNILPSPAESACSAFTSSSFQCDTKLTPENNSHDIQKQEIQSDDLTEESISSINLSPITLSTHYNRTHQLCQSSPESYMSESSHGIALSNSIGTLSLMARDSIEELSSPVRRSLSSLRAKRLAFETQDCVDESFEQQNASPVSDPTGQPALGVERVTSGTVKRKRALSHATGGRLLRRLIRPRLPSSWSSLER